MTGNRGIAQLLGYCNSEEFVFSRSTKQGGPEGPWEWNLIVRTILRNEKCRWENKGLALPLIGKWFTLRESPPARPITLRLVGRGIRRSPPEDPEDRRQGHA